MKVGNTWININTVYSLTNTKRIKIQNIGGIELYVQCSVVEPTDDLLSVVLDPKETLIVRPEQDDVWVKSPNNYSGWIFVQDNSPFDFSDNGIDPRVYSGLQGLTVQPFVEANVKNGTQFEASTYIPSLAAGQSVYSTIQTGNLPVLIKASELEVDGAGIQVTLYKNPVVSGGTITPSFNLDTGSGNTALSVIRSGVTVTSEGTQVSTPLTLLGGVRGGTNSVATNGTIGLDRVLEPNTLYLRKVTSIDTASQRVSLYTTWYEGPLSTDLL